MKRRALLIGSTAAAAAGLGAGLAWHRLQPEPVATEVVEQFFSLSFPDAAGAAQPLAQWRGKLLVVNFWATWCAPCIEEMPELEEVRQLYRSRNVEVIGIGIDSAAKIRAFRDDMKLTLPLLVAGAGGSEIGRLLGNGVGALPYTVLIDPKRRLVQRKLGRIRQAELVQWLDAQLA